MKAFLNIKMGEEPDSFSYSYEFGTEKRVLNFKLLVKNSLKVRGWKSPLLFKDAPQPVLEELDALLLKDSAVSCELACSIDVSHLEHKIDQKLFRLNFQYFERVTIAFAKGLDCEAFRSCCNTILLSSLLKKSTVYRLREVIQPPASSILN